MLGKKSSLGELRQDLIPECLCLVWLFAEASAAKPFLRRSPKRACALFLGKKHPERHAIE